MPAIALLTLTLTLTLGFRVNIYIKVYQFCLNFYQRKTTVHISEKTGWNALTFYRPILGYTWQL